MRKTAGVIDVALPERSADRSLSAWLYQELCRAIASGQLRAGARLPSTREFAKQHRISRGTVVAVFEQRQGPLVDGRPYADPEFIDLLEEYHQAAVSAHRSHGKVQLSLPAVAMAETVDARTALPTCWAVSSSEPSIVSWSSQAS